MIRTPLGLVRFKAKAARLQAAYSQRRAEWERDHPKVAVKEAPSNLSIEELKGKP